MYTLGGAMLAELAVRGHIELDDMSAMPVRGRAKS